MNWEQLKTIFDRALELDGDKRVQFLDDACGGDAGLRSEVEDLLESYEAADGFLSDEMQSDNTAGARDAGAPTPDEFPVVDRYQVCARIGAGGFGTVYLAEQLEPLQRHVALKVIRSGVLSQSVIKRFEAERQVLARMDHPNIAAVFDAGETAAGRPYLVMEYVDGCSIVKYCDDRRLTLRDRLALFLGVCAGVQHAHQKGIVHRDIKPSNVLVPTRDEDVIPKVIDFGVAKALEPDRSELSLTTQQQILGTPVYMSPEQAAAATEKIDTRSDIYSLGVLLYELLTGTTPFDSKALMSAGVGEMIRVIQTVDPERPSTRVAAALTQQDKTKDVSVGAAPSDASAHYRRTDSSTLFRNLRGDLDWIVMKCLEKDPDRRYSTAAALADDLQRYLDVRSIAARPPSVGDRVRKLVRRNRAAAIISIALVVALVGGATASTLGFLRASDARDDAQQAERSARAVTRYLAGILSEASPTRLGPDATVGEILDRRDDELSDRFKDQPLVEAEVRRTIGDAYSGMGWFEKGAEHLRRAVELYQMETGQGQDTLHAKVRLAANRRGAGQYEIAAQMLNDVLIAYGEADDIPVRQKLIAEYELATLLRIQKKYRAAGEWSERVYTESMASLGADDELTLSAQQNLASLYDATDRRAEALELLNDALATQVDTLGATHPDTLLSRFNLAIRNCLDGQHALAVELYPALLEDYASRLGSDHRMTNAVRSYFAFELAHVGRLSEADALITSTLADQQARLPATHRDVVESLRHGVEIKESLGAFEDAIPLAQQRLDALRQLYGDLDRQVLTAIINLGASYRSVGDVEKSESLLRQGIQGFRAALGPTHFETANSMAHLISLLHEQERHQEEAALIEEGLAAFRDIAIEDHAGYQGLRHRRGHLMRAQGRHADAIEDFRATFHAQLDTIRNLAQVIHYGDCLTNELLRQAQYDEAKHVIEQVLSGCDQSPQANTLKVASFLDRHAHCCMQLKAFEIGYQSAKKSLELRRALQPEDEYALSGSKMLLGVCALKLEKYDEAEVLLREVLAVREGVLNPDNWLLHNTRSVLGECLWRGGDRNEARVLIEQAHAALLSISSTPAQRRRESEQRMALIAGQVGAG